MFSDSKKELLDILKREGELTINQAADRIKLAKTTLREHLANLERDGYIERGYDRSGLGRPNLTYELTSKGDQLFPSNESKLPKELIIYLKEQHDEQILERFFESFWTDRALMAKLELGKFADREMPAKLDVLRDILDKEGFMTEFELSGHNNTLEIKECNCPFSAIVSETQLPCKLEALFYQTLFDGNVERISYIPDGDYACTYRITNPTLAL